MIRHKSQEKMVKISISLPSVFVEQIEQMAAADNRNRSNFIATTLRRIAEEKLGAK
ncbi:MAG: hypothetical protein SPF41_06660 [Candidatus Merdousia sp.]|nr:hypothetical protein [Candidatus Merdousia sp.]